MGAAPGARVVRRLLAGAGLTLALLTTAGLPGGTAVAAPGTSPSAATGASRPELLLAGDHRMWRVPGDLDDYEDLVVVDAFAEAGGPVDAAAAPDGDLYVVTPHALWRVPSGSDAPVLVDGEGLGRLAGVAVDSQGVVYASDAEDDVVRRWRGGARDVLADVADPRMISVDHDDALLVPSAGDSAVYRFTPSGARTTVVTGTERPTDAVETSDGSVVVGEWGGDVVLVSPGPDGTPQRRIVASLGQGISGLAAADGPAVYVNISAFSPGCASIMCQPPVPEGFYSSTFTVPLDGGDDPEAFVSDIREFHGLARGEFTQLVPLSITPRVRSASRANAAGWYRTPVTVAYRCAGGTAPLACPGAVQQGTTAPAGTLLERRVTDAAGNAATSSRLVKVDAVPPVLAAKLAPGPYDRTSRPVRCTATDAVSGVAGTCKVAYGALERTAKGLRRTWTATTRDVAGNTTEKTGSFRVTG